MLVYLSGPITGLTYDGANDWRKRVADEVWEFAECLNPMRGKGYLKKEEVILTTYEQYPMSTAKGIVGRDRWDVQRADIMLVNLLGAEKVSVGTVIEVGWADSKRIPIVLVMEEEGNIHDGRFLRQLATYIVPTLEEAIEIVKVLADTGI